VNLDTSNPQLPIFSNPTDETFYYALSGVGGCELTDSIQVIYNLPSTFEISAEGPFCEGGEILLDNPLQGFTYQWSTGAGSEDIIVSTAGTYSLQVSDSAGCSIIDEIEIQTLIPIDFEILGETFACAGESISLTADVVSDNYLWSNGATDQTAIYFGEGTTTVWAEIIDANNCASRDSLDIVFSLPIEIELIAAGAICEGVPTALTAVVSEGDILWESGETAEQITVSEAGVYTVIVSDTFGCESTDSIEIFEVNFPTLNLDSDFCEDASVIIAPVVDFGFDFQWSSGEETATIEISEPGNYELILSQFDCEQTYNFVVAEQPAPQLDIVIEGDFCSTELPAGGYPLTAVSDGAVMWQDGIEAEVLTITQSGVYAVSATSPEGCVTTSEIAIVETCPDPAIYAPNAFTPDNDGLNDVWNVEYDGELTSFSLIIFDRDGNVVFRTTDAREYWIGDVNGGEYYAKDGVYNYLIKYSAVRGENGLVSNELRGHIVLLR
jgi:gliding motility-associated-like protein